MAFPKRPRDINQLANLIGRIATGETEDNNPDEGKNPKAIIKGRKGGLKGGKARADKLSSERKKEIAKKAIEARWKRKNN